jgi:hypothetical protein
MFQKVSIYAIGLSLFLTGCCGYKMDPSKHAKVLVYPSIDIRTENNLELEKFDKKKCFLKKRVLPAENFLQTKYFYMPCHLSDPTTATINYNELQNPNSDQLKSLPSNGVRYVLIVVIKEFHYQFNVINNHAKAELGGYLIDTNIGEIIWHNEAEKSSAIGALDIILFGYDCSGIPMVTMRGAMDKLLENMPVLMPESMPN